MRPDEPDAEAWLARLETLRRSVDLRLDREGRWFHEGAPFEHQGLISAFNRGLDVHDETGEPILRVGSRWCYIAADDSPFLVRGWRRNGEGLTALLNTEERLPVPDGGFEQVGDDVYVALAPRRRARLDRTARQGLVEWLIEEGGRLWIEVADRRWPIREVSRGSVSG